VGAGLPDREAGDVETLARALVAQGLVDRRKMLAGAPLEQVLRAADDPSAPPARADELAAALLASTGPLQ